MDHLFPEIKIVNPSPLLRHAMTSGVDWQFPVALGPDSLYQGRYDPVHQLKGQQLDRLHTSVI